MSKTFMRDQAHRLKTSLLRGQHNTLPAILEINVDHCLACTAFGLLLGHLLWF